MIHVPADLARNSKNAMVNSATNIQFPLLNDYKPLLYGISARRDGSMKLGVIIGQDQNTENRNKFFSAAGLDSNAVVSAGIVHKSDVQPVSIKDSGKILSNSDGLITDNVSVTLSVTVADCFPIFLYAPDVQAIGIVHAGWRGILEGIIKNTVLSFNNTYNANPKNLIIGVGPGIHACHFEVDENTAKLFSDFDFAVLLNNGKYFIDLTKVILKQFELYGVHRSNIEIHQDCTYCEDKKYYSYRRLRSKDIKAMVAYIGLVPK